MKFQCNRAYINNYIPEKQLNLYRSTKSIRCGCDWVVNFRFSDHKKKDQNKDEVTITHVNPYHTKDCKPSNDQFVLAKTRSGDYSDYISLIMQDLMKISDVGQYVSSITIHE